MIAKELQSYLNQQIPASESLQIGVNNCSRDKVELLVPLQPNINHKNTAFGGSISVAAILSAWSLIYLNIRDSKNEIVIQNSEMSYIQPIHSDFESVSIFCEPKQWERFHKSFNKKGKGRITVSSKIYCNGCLAAKFSGTFVAFNKQF